MIFEFDHAPNRFGSDSEKWKVKEGELPMWVADMDFYAAPCIQNALRKRLDEGVYGYASPDARWAHSYARFYFHRHGWQLKEDSLFFSTGVVPSISSSIRALTEKGDEVVVLTPTYNNFFNSIVNNGRVPLSVPLRYESGGYDIDFALLENAFSSAKAKLFLLCNPQNPISRIWQEEELRKIGFLAKKHGIIVLSDEIHGEITRPLHPYTPFLSVEPSFEEFAFAALSPTKAFNIAGIQTSALYVPNTSLRKKVERQLNTDECAEGNVFAYEAAIAAFDEGEEWLDAACAYLFANRDFAVAYLKTNCPELHIVRGDATYLLWIDIHELGVGSDSFVTYLKEKTGLILLSGSLYGQGGEGFLRMNIACPRSTLADGLKRLSEGVSLFKKH